MHRLIHKGFMTSNLVKEKELCHKDILQMGKIKADCILLQENKTA